MKEDDRIGACEGPAHNVQTLHSTFHLKETP